MNIIFAAGDIGGARSILPVARLAHSSSHTIMCLAHGALQQEGCADWHWFNFEEALAFCRLGDVVVYATSVDDTAAVEVAMLAKNLGVPCLHVLDNWSSYSERIQVFVPQAYAVMDELALNEAVLAGVPRNILHTTGHPDLAKLAHEQSIFPGPTGEQTIFFVSEPAANDGGIAKRGYDETVVTRGFIKALCKLAAENLTLKIAPHPRENRKVVEKRIRNLCTEFNANFNWLMVEPHEVRSTLHCANRCVGMTSILLYESWLLGRPTLSLQPQHAYPKKVSFSNRSGLVVNTSHESYYFSMKSWLGQSATSCKSDIYRHDNAAQSIVELAHQLVVSSANNALAYDQ